MPNQLAMSGSQSQKQKNRKYAPIWWNRFISGYWPNRNPLRDASLTVLAEKFYGALNDALYDGLNCELNTRSELSRRAGNSVYNPNTFGPIQRFYSYDVFGVNSNASYRRVLASTATSIYDISNGIDDTLIYTKPIGAGKTTFQAIGDTLFFADGISPQQYLNFLNSWTPFTSYEGGTQIEDSNGNVQLNLGAAVEFSGIQISTSGVMTISVNFGVSNVNTFEVGYPVVFAGVTGLTSLNNQTGIVQSINFGSNQFTLSGNYAGLVLPSALPYNQSNTGFAYNINVGAKSGLTQPIWSTQYQGIVIDSNTAWQFQDSVVRPIGIIPPTVAPSVTNTPAPIQGNAWAGSTYYFPGQVIYDSTGNTIQQLSTAGTTASSPPTFSTTVGTTTTDGSAVWTCISSGNTGSTSAVRATTTVYNVNAVVLNTWSNTHTFSVKINGVFTPEYLTTTYSVFFQCTTPGTSSSIANTAITWPISGTYTDGTVIWTFLGLEVKRGTTSSAPSLPTSGNALTPGSIGNSTLVSLFGSPTSVNLNSGLINDALTPGAGVGNLETISVAGLTGSTHPTWPTTVNSVGVTTVDDQAQWLSSGSSGSAANTGYWTYAYAYASTSTPDVSEASPLSIPIIESANSYISINGAGTVQVGVNEVYLYRTAQQSTNIPVTGDELFLIAIIPLPPNGANWSYLDQSQDPPSPSSTMNFEITGDTILTNTPPLSGLTNLVYYLGRLWGSVGNTIYASAGPDVTNGGNPYTAFPPDNFMDMPSTVIRMLATPQGLLVFTAENIQVITGNGVSSTAGESGFTTFVPNVYIDDLSLGNYDSLTTDGGVTYIYTVDHNIVSISSGGLNWISTAVSNKLQTSFTLSNGNIVDFNPLSTYLTWYVSGDDYGLLISDGTYGWFRMMPSASPDTGSMVWSPFAEIVGGVSAVQYIQTDSSGQHHVLIGPQTSGPILKRDNTVSTDNGSTFTWFATFGSVVLSHPGEVAMVQSIVIDSVAIGSHPVLTVYFNEISDNGVGNTYTKYVYDPYTADQSTTTYADRFYMSDDQTACAVCRHLQFTLSFPAEDIPNTILSSTIIGATEYDN
jgi:hypothetical protein